MRKSGHAAREQQSMPREIRDSRFRQGDTRRDSKFFTVGVGDSQRAGYWEGREGVPCVWQPLGTNRLVLKQTREIRVELHHGAVANFLPRSPQDLLRVCMRNVPQGYMCFNTQSPVGGAVWGRWQTLAGGTGIQGCSRGSKPSSASYPSSHHQLLTCKSHVLPLPWTKSTPATVLSLDSGPDVPKGEPT